MSVFSVSVNLNAAPGNGSLRAIRVTCRRRVLVLLALLTAGAQGGAQTVPLAESESMTEEEATVAYVSEVPWQWNSEQGNPVEHWARKLAAHWIKKPDNGDERLRNLLPQLSWERLAKTSRNRGAGAFVVHAYEWIERGDDARLDALLVPSRDGRAAMTQFVILRQRRELRTGEERKFSMEDLRRKDILVDRGGCGELVYRWLDCEIKPETGAKHREDHADYRSATGPTEAVLAVYFGEVDACVVSRASYAEVQRTNPRGLAARLEEARISPPLLNYVIACPRDMPGWRRVPLMKSAASVHLLQTDGSWTLTAPHPDDFKSLRHLISDWERYYGDSKEEQPQTTPSPDSPARPGAAARISERRRP